jgi:hypothetical protein
MGWPLGVPGSLIDIAENATLQAVKLPKLLLSVLGTCSIENVLRLSAL